MKYFYRLIKHSYQRITRGFSDRELWSLDCSILAYALPRLKEFKKLGNSVPFGLTGPEWFDIIDQMILEIELYDEDGDLTMFFKYFNHLWD